jgi:hypothetical protein
MIRVPYVLAALMVTVALSGAARASTSTDGGDSGVTPWAIWDDVVSSGFSAFQWASSSAPEWTKVLHHHKDKTADASERRQIDSDLVESSDAREQRRARRDRLERLDRREHISADFIAPLDVTPSVVPMPAAGALVPLTAMLAALCALRLRRRAAVQR